jgi:cytochrome c-type biogenesis protein CcmH/NrfF
VLIYTCPETNEVVTTNIDTSKEDLTRLGMITLSLWCPHCQTGHKITASDATATRLLHRVPQAPMAPEAL